MSFFIGYNVDALSMGRVTNQFGAIIRIGPSIEYSKITKLTYQDTVPIISIIKTPATSKCSSGWYKLNYNGTIAYSCSSNFSISNYTLKVDSTTGVNIRIGAGTKYDVYKHLLNNKLLTLNSTKKISGGGCTGGWYKLNYDGSTSRYICSDYTDNFNSKSNVIVTTQNGASVKTSTTTTSSIAKLKYGQALTLYSTSKYKANNCSEGYYKVYYQGQVRYICGNSVLNSQNNGTIQSLKGGAIRTGPGTEYLKIITFNYGDNVTLEDTTKYEGTGCPAGWYKIKLNGYYRYICSSSVSTSPYSTTVKGHSSMIVRTGPGTEYLKITTLKEDDLLILDSNNKYEGTGCPDGWYKISVNGYSRYVCSTYTEINQEANRNSSNSSNDKTMTKVSLNSSSHYYTTNTWNYKISENYANVRSSSSSTSTLKDVIYLGTEVKPMRTSGDYTKISYYNNKTGWVLTSLIEKYSDVTKTNSTYCTQLKNAGFPESYCPYLSYLHSKHPNWIFIAEQTGDTFKNAVINESEKNYTTLTESVYLASGNPNDIAENPNWRVASDAYIAYMIDPRNYLNEKNIFVFESLSYNENYHTKSAVRSVLDGTYLDTDTYASYFVNAGQSYGVSPIHLASRVKQEGGTNSNYAAVSGTVTDKWQVTTSGYVCSRNTTLSGSKLIVSSGHYVVVRTGPGTNNVSLKLSNGNTMTANKNDDIIIASTKKYDGQGCEEGWYKIKSVSKSLKGYYNYYNIGAYGDNPVIRGIAAAAGFVDNLDGTPWNTRKKAITYGAKFIAEGYINKGQDTLFYQKFNVGPNTAQKYTHQYMTNIIAPASESLSTYYLNNNSTAYVFKIPVYEDMPTEHTSHPPVGSITAHLNTLK